MSASAAFSPHGSTFCLLGDLYQPRGIVHPLSLCFPAFAVLVMFSSKSPSSKARTKKPVSRKQRRKQERADKKQKKTGRFLKGEEVIIQPSSPAPTKSSPHQNDKKRPIPSKPKLSHTQHHESGLARLHRKRTVEVPNTRDDIEISRLEKLLKIKKKKLPTSFKDEGLDCILCYLCLFDYHYCSESAVRIHSFTCD